MANIPQTVLGNFDGIPRLRVARPGYDVTDTALLAKYLGFDSAWQEATNIFMTGYVATTQAANPVTISFGITFDFIPCVMLWEVTVAGNTALTNANNRFDYPALVYGGGIGMPFAVYRDKMIINSYTTNNRPIGEPDKTKLNYYFCYIVLANPLAA